MSLTPSSLDAPQFDEETLSARKYSKGSPATGALRWLKERLTNRYDVSARELTDDDMARIQSMVAATEAGKEIVRPSLYWSELNRVNIDQLRHTGFDNFKRTLALNYFTFVNILPWDPQIRALLAAIPPIRVARIAARALAARSAEFYSSVNWIQTRIYHFLTLAMRERLKAMRIAPQLLDLTEPPEGGAIEVADESGHMISADLCNSVAEYHFVACALTSSPRTVLELGGGYGRTAYVWLSMRSCRYIMVDIAPALWVAERYLSAVFPDRKVFRWRPFTAFADVASEFEAADICFLTPDQLEALPGGLIDLGLNISSLHEMTIEKIGYFLGEFDRLLKVDGNFYLKAWTTSVLPIDEVVIEKADYPFPETWSTVAEQTPVFQPTFFETLFRKEEGPLAR